MTKSTKAGPAISAENLARKLNDMLDAPLTSNPLNLGSELEGLLTQIGESTQNTGGEITFYGEDPIVPSRVAFGAMSALALAAKSALVASIWRDRTGQEQNIHVDIRKAIRRFAPFSEGKWELLNGYPPQGDMFNPFNSLPIIHPTADGGWALPGAWYPGLRQRTLQFLKAQDDPNSIVDAIGKWDRYKLDGAGEKAGVPIAVLRSLREVLAHDAFKHNLGCQPLISIEKSATPPQCHSRKTRLRPWRVFASLVTSMSSLDRPLVVRWHCTAPTFSTFSVPPKSSWKPSIARRMWEPVQHDLISPRQKVASSLTGCWRTLIFSLQTDVKVISKSTT